VCRFDELGEVDTIEVMNGREGGKEGGKWWKRAYYLWPEKGVRQTRALNE